MAENFTLNFHAELPALDIVSISIWDTAARKTVIVNKRLDTNTAGLDVFDYTNNGEYKTYLRSGITELHYDVRFSLPFDDVHKTQAATALKCEAFFPIKLKNPSIAGAAWLTSTDTLYTSWDGFEAGDSDEAHFYKLTIPGGKSGVSPDGNSFLQESIIIYIEVVEL
jgi:hypothetical protein